MSKTGTRQFLIKALFWARCGTRLTIVAAAVEIFCASPLLIIVVNEDKITLSPVNLKSQAILNSVLTLNLEKK